MVGIEITIDKRRTTPAEKSTQLAKHLGKPKKDLTRKIPPKTIKR